MDFFFVFSCVGVQSGSFSSGHLTRVLREIRRLGSDFSEVDSAFLKKRSAGCVHGVRTRLCIFFMENGVDFGKPRPKTSDLGVIWGIADRVTLANLM